MPPTGFVYLEAAAGDGTDVTFVDNLYRVMLGREPEPGEERRRTMRRVLLTALLGLLFGAPSARALEAVGTIKKVDAAGGTMIVFANGQELSSAL